MKTKFAPFLQSTFLTGDWYTVWPWHLYQSSHKFLCRLRTVLRPTQYHKNVHRKKHTCKRNSL